MYMYIHNNYYSIIIIIHTIYNLLFYVIIILSLFQLMPTPGTIKWRDTWAYVTVKGKESISGEDVGKSISVTNWGNPVNLHVHVAMKTDGESGMTSGHVLET